MCNCNCNNGDCHYCKGVNDGLVVGLISGIGFGILIVFAITN